MGTAVGIAMIEEIGNEYFKIAFTKGNPVGNVVQDTLNKIKVQELEDTFGWIVEAK